MAGERVLILVQNEPVPSDRHVWNECRALRGAGYEVRVICPAGATRDRGGFERREGIEIHRYRPRSARGRAWQYGLEYAAALWNMHRLIRQLGRRHRFDLVHACSPPDFLLLAALGQRRRGARFVFDHHDLTPELYRTRFGAGPVHRMTLAAEQVAFRAADVVLSVNESYRRLAIGRGRRDRADVVVVRTGPDLRRFAPTEPDRSLRRESRHLLAYVGVMGAQDGLEDALHSLAHLRRRRDDWHAVFMGDGDALAATRERAEELGLDECLEFTGWVEQETIRRVLSSADVCLAPEPKSPLNDVSSMVKISEYMAMAKPFVAYDLAESRRAAGAAGAFAAAGDHAGFARHVSDLLDDPERRAAMGAAGRERAESSLAWEHQERALLAAYRRALALGPVRESRMQTFQRLVSFAW